MQLRTLKDRAMKNYQTIQVNVGLNWSQDGKSGEFDRELGRFLVETKFPYTGITSEPYVSEWTDDSGKTYADNCLAFKISVPKIHAMSIGEIEKRIENLRIILKQDAIAFSTKITTGGVDYEHSDVYYGEREVEDKLIFNPEFFHYVK